MKCLYIDTSSNYLYTSIVDGDKLIGEIKKDYGQSLSEVALPEIASIFKNNNISPNEIEKIIVVNGPGSFTGIRIGITIGKVYAWSLNIPITTIYSLEAMALSSNNKMIHVPIINARRGFVYAAIYDEDIKEILKPQHLKIDKLKEKLNTITNYEIISNDDFEDFENIQSYSPDMLKIVKFFEKKESINPHLVNPEYLKLTEAEESKL